MTTRDRDPGDVRTEQMKTSVGAAGPSLAFAVRPVEGADGGKEVHVDAASGSMLVGTSPSCELGLGDRMVSRRHAALELAGAFLRVTDLDSTNGTWVNGTRVREAFACAGDFIRVGATVLAVREARASDSRLTAAASFGRVVGASVAMRRLYPMFERLAASAVPVIIEGESGTGKELLAETLHEMGPRSAAPFVVVDCSALAPDAVESELFVGTTEEPGAVERARGGTLLVEHVSELNPSLQAKLLRVIDAAGGAAGGPRLIATSRRDLDKEVEAGRFREDLFFRLVVGRIELPPLRNRAGDVALLAQFFWKKVDAGGRSMPADFLRRYEGHVWPGNVRELASAVARRIAMGDADDPAIEVSAADVAPENAFRWLLAQDLAFPMARSLLLAEFERVFVEKALAQHDGNVSRAAAASGLARRYFQIMRARLR